MTMTKFATPRRAWLLFAVLALALPACVTDGPAPPTDEEKERAKDPFKELFDQAREDPDNHELQATLGFAFWRDKRDPNRARIHFERALELAGRHKYTGYHYILGLIYRDLREYDKALVEMEDTFLVPEESGRTTLEDNYYRMSQWMAARIYAENKRNPEKALVSIQRYHELGGNLDNQKEVYEAITRVYIQKKDAKNATLALEKFKALDGNKGDAWELGRAIRKLEEQQEREAEKAESGEPDTPSSANIGPKDTR